MEQKEIHPCPRFVGAQVKHWRKKRGHTQKAIAAICRIKYRHFQEIESGRVDIKLRTLGAIAQGLGVTPQRILTPVTETKRLMCPQCREQYK